MLSLVCGIVNSRSAPWCLWVDAERLSGLLYQGRGGGGGITDRNPQREKEGARERRGGRAGGSEEVGGGGSALLPILPLPCTFSIYVGGLASSWRLNNWVLTEAQGQCVSKEPWGLRCERGAVRS